MLGRPRPARPRRRAPALARRVLRRHLPRYAPRAFLPELPRSDAEGLAAGLLRRELPPPAPRETEVRPCRLLPIPPGNRLLPPLNRPPDPPGPTRDSTGELAGRQRTTGRTSSQFTAADAGRTGHQTALALGELGDR